jgi:hypothetical protein
MSTRETLMVQFAADIATSVKAAYPWAPVGCTRELPGDLRQVDQLSPESTPLVYIEEGDEEYPESENGWTRLKLPVMLTGVIKRSTKVTGSMQTAANLLLAIMQKAAWAWTSGVPGCDVTVTTEGPSVTNCGPDQARVGVDIALSFTIQDTNP